ncbi:(d)CMP kinase [candidate division KSB1 bacterium]|nr:(d)CMP kinase [candidate division KSB1 bacterium]
MVSGKKICIAIDGPAGSGKSTTAKLVAERLGYLHLDTGAMYRAVTLNVLQNNIDIYDENKVVEIARMSDIKLEKSDNVLKVYLNGTDVSQEIRTPQVTKSIAPIAANPRVREILVAKQRQVMKNGGVVAEGRDIGSNVCPNAELKIFLVASIEERAKRRYKELTEKGIQVDMDELIADIKLRDSHDTGRKANPLKQAQDAVLLDTSNLTIAQQVDFVIRKALEITS